jgi:hypothetical protein
VRVRARGVPLLLVRRRGGVVAPVVGVAARRPLVGRPGRSVGVPGQANIGNVDPVGTVVAALRDAAQPSAGAEDRGGRNCQTFVLSMPSG